MNITNRTMASFAAILFTVTTYSQNPLFIPDTLSGTIFNLDVQTGTKVFFTGYNTPTYGYNGSFLGPTLFMNKGDSVTLNVTNNLPVPTTVHWHGFHVAPKYDGGPHQIILPNATWSPSFKVRNNAATYWYHPHGENKTEMQVGRGLAGMIIIRDSAEASYSLPRTYGVDDFPLIVQSRAFDVLYQVAMANHEDSVPMVNGTIDPYLEVPKQVVRFRLLNASADRSYLFGFNNNMAMHLIASDGGMLSNPVTLNRLRLSPGERAEILVNFGPYPQGQSVYLMSYASELPTGTIGADSVGTAEFPMGEGYYTNPLNGLDFNLVRLDIIAATANAITSMPSAFEPVVPWDTLDVDAHRHVHFSPDTALFGEHALVDGPFFINNTTFHMDSVNIITYRDNKEIWTLTNSTLVAHPFHIHDVQFNILDINGNPPPPAYGGWKDVVLVNPDDTVRFIAKFETFADNHVPYMYHCHLLHHEDEGMMGSFLVMDTTVTGSGEPGAALMPELLVYPNPANGFVNLEFGQWFCGQAEMCIYDASGKLHYSKIVTGPQQIDTRPWDLGLYHVCISCNGRVFNARLVKQ